MKNEDKKERISADIPFSFLSEMGHNTRAMERFFELPRNTREILTDAVSTADNPEDRTEQALKSLAQGGEGYCEKF